MLKFQHYSIFFSENLQFSNIYFYHLSNKYLIKCYKYLIYGLIIREFKYYIIIIHKNTFPYFFFDIPYRLKMLR